MIQDSLRSACFDGHFGSGASGLRARGRLVLRGYAGSGLEIWLLVRCDRACGSHPPCSYLLPDKHILNTELAVPEHPFRHDRYWPLAAA